MKNLLFNTSILLTLFFGTPAKAQEVQLNKKITSNYHDLSATHQLLQAGTRKTVFTRMQYSAYEPLMGVVYTITTSTGAAKQLTFVLGGGTGFLAQNLEEIQSFTVSIATITSAEKDSRDWVNHTQEVEIVSVRGDKLFARLLSPDKKPDRAATASMPQNDEDVPAQFAETKAILEWFFGSSAVKGIQLNSEDKRIADIMFNELVAGSCKMTFVESITPFALGSYASAGKFIQKIATRLLRNGYANCYKDAKNGEYSVSVRNKILAKYRTPFANRKQNGEWLMD